MHGPFRTDKAAYRRYGRTPHIHPKDITQSEEVTEHLPSKECPDCEGTGKVADVACARCKGSGKVEGE